MWPWHMNMPTQNLLMLYLLLMRIVLATICCRFRSWGLVKMLRFCSDFDLTWLWLLSTRFGQDLKLNFLFSSFDLCDHSIWRCQLRTCWCCYFCWCWWWVFMQIWKPRFGHKAKLWFRLSAQGLVKIWSWISGDILKLKFGQHFAAAVWLRLYKVQSWSRFWC